jgi:hypothetical protein
VHAITTPQAQWRQAYFSWRRLATRYANCATADELITLFQGPQRPRPLRRLPSLLRNECTTSTGAHHQGQGGPPFELGMSVTSCTGRTHSLLTFLGCNICSSSQTRRKFWSHFRWTRRPASASTGTMCQRPPATLQASGVVQQASPRALTLDLRAQALVQRYGLDCHVELSLSIGCCVAGSLGCWGVRYWPGQQDAILTPICTVFVDGALCGCLPPT